MTVSRRLNFNKFSGIHRDLTFYPIPLRPGRSASSNNPQEKNMKTMKCECGHEETGSTDKDAMTKMQSHIHNDHPDRSTDAKKILKKAEKTVKDAVPTM
jgi:hypothetical protein